MRKFIASKNLTKARIVQYLGRNCPLPRDFAVEEVKLKAKRLVDSGNSPMVPKSLPPPRGRLVGDVWKR